MYQPSGLKNFFRQIFSKNIVHWISYREISGSAILICVALLVGITSGAGVLLFKKMIELVHWGALNGFGFVLLLCGHWAFMLVPVMPLAGGLIVGLVIHFFFARRSLSWSSRCYGSSGIGKGEALLSTFTDENNCSIVIRWFWCICWT